MLTIDTSTDFGTRATARLADEDIVWLTTVDPDGVPQPTPVWFLWTGTDVLIASQPRTAKLRNIAAHPRVAVNFNGTETGGDVVVLTGAAVHDEAGLSADELAGYDAKYGAAIKDLGMTNEGFHADYSEIVRITPAKLRGF